MLHEKLKYMGASPQCILVWYLLGIMENIFKHFREIYYFVKITDMGVCKNLQIIYNAYF